MQEDDDDLQFFDEAFRGWLTAFHHDRELPELSEEAHAAFRQTFDKRIPSAICTTIGAGLRSGFLQTTQFKVCVSHSGNRPWGVLFGQGTLWWEFFVQLAEAVHIEPVARAAGLMIKLEDSLMDITLSRQHDLIVYIEAKEDAGEARALVAGMHVWGRQPQAQQPERAKDDSLKKVRYLQRSRPPLFSIRAVDYAADYRVEYAADGTLTLEPLTCSLADAIMQTTASMPALISPAPGAPATQQPLPNLEGIDTVAHALVERCPELDLDPGTGTTALNAYATIAGNDIIVLGFMQDGSLWTELKDFSDEQCAALLDSFSTLPIQLDTKLRNGKRSGRFWRTDKKRTNWRHLQPDLLAQAVSTFLDRIN